MDILVIEDDVLLGAAIQRALRHAGYETTWEQTGARGLERLQALGDGVALVDLGLPDIDGLEVLRAARSGNVTAPIIVMTARDDVGSKVTALDAGADDYLSKPFHLDELRARIRSVTRRCQARATRRVEVGTLHIDLDNYDVQSNGERVELTAKEFALLRALAEHPGRIVRREVLERMLYDSPTGVSSSALEVLVHGVRRKIGPERIRTVRGMGYLILADGPAETNRSPSHDRLS
ncbi:two-component system, OmpR family, response regulator [Luteibacter sp. UNC138MFCol5.1]|uniref:response regulator n=1 Tax=Luteibacter sp. UNC138MFCol5.1 TaxID=1502774 RepID=UPI0008CABC10|nr:response regulator transcription factor [Luteibacter sp. UNC138MFCol5.1]SEO66184.1 two-component system, OmpR family, response regulator [Luteibacter sp. UNC138MFCol5.1]